MPPLRSSSPPPEPATRRLRSSPLARVASASIRVALVWIALAALQPAPAIARERPRTPEEVSAQRVAGSIEDRVRIDLETAGGELAAAEIEVAATPDGHVTLSGRVPSSEAKARAEQRARWAVGVTAVENRLEIVAPPTPPVAAVRAGPDRAGAAPTRIRRIGRRTASSRSASLEPSPTTCRSRRVRGTAGCAAGRSPARVGPSRSTSTTEGSDSTDG